ncbi:MAG: hypothetical protein ACYSWU_04020 [Planctomycetota bacterium]
MSQFLNDGVDEPDAAVDQFLFNRLEPGILLQSLGMISSSQVETFRFAIRGNDHPDRHAVVLTGPHFADIDSNKLLAGGHGAPDVVPVLEDVDLKCARIADGVHIEQSDPRRIAVLF